MTPSFELTLLGRISAVSNRGIFGRVCRLLAWPLCDNIGLLYFVQIMKIYIHVELNGASEAGKWFPLAVQISLQTYSERLWL